jgi:hypothetical protein
MGKLWKIGEIGKKGKRSKKLSRFAPNEGYRYDGIYRVVNYW